MSYKSGDNPPSTSFEREAGALFATLDQTSPDATTACYGWTAHDVTAHLTAGALEVALNLEAYSEGKPVPPTRSFEEREAPYKEMDDRRLRTELSRSIARMSSIVDAVLTKEPNAVVPWTGRQMVVRTFLTHLRSEFAIHRFDLTGDDDTGNELLAQPELTNHAVDVLGNALLVRGSNAECSRFSAVLASPGTYDIVVLVDSEGARLIRSKDFSEPSVIGDSAARLLFLWGRRPGDPSRLRAPGGTSVLRLLQRALMGY